MVPRNLYCLEDKCFKRYSLLVLFFSGLSLLCLKCLVVWTLFATNSDAFELEPTISFLPLMIWWDAKSVPSFLSYISFILSPLLFHLSCVFLFSSSLRFQLDFRILLTASGEILNRSAKRMPSLRKI